MRLMYLSVNRATTGSDNDLLPDHNLSQCWYVVKWTLGNKFRWNSNLNPHIFFPENASHKPSANLQPFYSILNVLKNQLRQKNLINGDEELNMEWDGKLHRFIEIKRYTDNS